MTPKSETRNPEGRKKAEIPNPKRTPPAPRSAAVASGAAGSDFGLLSDLGFRRSDFTPNRCPWPKTELDLAYHDHEWGVPLHDDRALFEFLVLEGAQAGLSWATIIKKRENYRRAFDRFDAVKVARYDAGKVARLLADPGIVRNRLKIAAAIQNARAFLAVREEFGSFDRYIWQFVGGRPKQNAWRTMKQVPATTPESDAMSRDLSKRGFKFVGSTICYALMQATGMVNDHLVGCFRHREIHPYTHSAPSGG